MGDICDMNDIERFFRSPEGRAHLEGIRRVLVGRTITEVEFINEVHFVNMTLRLDSGETFAMSDPSMEVEAIREKFEDALEREYYVDFPQRKP